MPDHSQQDFATTELDPHLLSTPFGVQTNWQVITGGPSCGKTTLINLLANKGFRTAPEGARLYIEREVARGQTVEEIRANMVALQRGIKDMQLVIERGLRPADIVFLDRAVPDTLAWYRVFGLNPNEFLLECFHHRYASVFILDQLPLELNGFRFEDDAYTGFLDQWHTRDYNALGYKVIRVPVLPPEERLAFTLERLSERGFI
ncbi:MAG: ATP-binding protein [Anaerolineales bacterium]|jgi:predicted ATPase